jgi:hypothetical protein
MTTANALKPRLPPDQGIAAAFEATLSSVASVHRTLHSRTFIYGPFQMTRSFCVSLVIIFYLESFLYKPYSVPTHMLSDFPYLPWLGYLDCRLV